MERGAQIYGRIPFLFRRTAFMFSAVFRHILSSRAFSFLQKDFHIVVPRVSVFNKKKKRF